MQPGRPRDIEDVAVVRRLLVIAVVLGAGIVAALGLDAGGAPHASSGRLRAGAASRAPARTERAKPGERVVALGDSVPAGTSCGCTPYVDLIADGLSAARGTDVAAENLAIAGQTTTGLLTQLQEPQVARALGRADVVIVTVGANDLEQDSGCTPMAASTCYDGDLGGLRSSYARMLDQLRSMVPTTTQIVLTGYWNVFLDGAVARQKGPTYVHNSEILTRAVNQIVASAAAARSMTYVDVFTPFKGDGDSDDTGLLALDGDHPDAEGHRVIAASIAAALTT